MDVNKKCIYILEDNDDIREILSLLLTEENYEVHGYPTVKSFQHEMRSTSPDLIVLDIMLGDGNGLDVCNEIKSDWRTHNIPILMMSAHVDEVDTKCKAEGFISKPFDITDFVKRVDYYLH